MNYYKVKFLKNNQPQGMAYTFKSDLDLSAGDTVDLDGGKHGIIVEEPVDLAWVKTYGNENLKEIVGKHEDQESTETFDSAKAVKAQNDYCEENKYLHFAPSDGRCWKCNQDIYAKDGKTRSGKVVDGISVEKARTALITGCPFCNWSYCE